MKYIVITVSDTSSFDAKKDLSGPEIIKFMGKENILLGKEIISDDVDKIISIFNKWLSVEDLDLILTTGGTGIGPRDVTPEATKKVIDYEIPGIPELMRVKNYLNTDYVSLSRAVAGVKSEKLIINLPGSIKAVQENLKIIYPLLKHAIELINGNTKH
jgi:molybdenum cofactor synthesis domain-containing protein|tara:strand:+ start:577 stop:1050 length:474 start_codon:yes stop_codon:yes gene_type:complete